VCVCVCVCVCVWMGEKYLKCLFFCVNADQVFCLGNIMIEIKASSDGIAGQTKKNEHIFFQVNFEFLYVLYCQ